MFFAILPAAFLLLLLFRDEFACLRLIADVGFCLGLLDNCVGDLDWLWFGLGDLDEFFGLLLLLLL